MKVAHLSDIHFFKFNLSPRTFFSKDILASLNYLINRSRYRVDFNLEDIPKLLKIKDVTHVIISGDFTTTSNLKEYRAAKEFIQKLHDHGLKTVIIPGNHDNYNKRAAKSKRFYQMLEAPNELRDQSISIQDLGEGFKIISLDTTIPTPFWSSQGLFSKELEKRLTSLLDQHKGQPLILLNHFPTLTKKHLPVRKIMRRYEKLKEILDQSSNIKLYIFGHTHMPEMIQDKTLFLNSGSLTLTKGGAFHIMDLNSESARVEAYSYQSGKWEVCNRRVFELV